MYTEVKDLWTLTQSYDHKELKALLINVSRRFFPHRNRQKMSVPWLATALVIVFLGLFGHLVSRPLLKVLMENNSGQVLKNVALAAQIADALQLFLMIRVLQGDAGIQSQCSCYATIVIKNTHMAGQAVANV